MKQFFLLFVLSVILLIGESQAQDIISDYQQFITAYNEKKYEQCVQLGAQLARYTDHPGIQYKLAACYCQTDQLPKSLDQLGFQARRGLPYRIEENEGFSRLYGGKRFAEYTKAFMKNRTTVNKKSTVSFVINNFLLIPEGIAYDSLHQTFFIGSLARHKVIRCTGNGNCSDFVVGKAGYSEIEGGVTIALWHCMLSDVSAF